MAVRMKTILAGPKGNFSAGSLADVDEKTAKDLIKGGFAEKIESASVEPPEKAQMPKAKAKRGRK